MQLRYFLPAGATRAEIELREPSTDALVASLAWGDGETPAESPRRHAPLVGPGKLRLEARIRTKEGGLMQRTRELELGPDDVELGLHLEQP